MSYWLTLKLTRIFLVNIPTLKIKTPVLGNAVPVLGWETKTGVVRILIIFQPRPMFSHINGKLSPRPFE